MRACFVPCCLLSVLLIAPTWAAEPVDPQPAATVTVPRAEWEAVKTELQSLRRELEELKASSAAPPPAAPEPSSPAAAQPAPSPTGGGRSLLLPDISLIVQAQGLVSSDRRDPDRDKLLLREAELGIQGYVYPNVKADAFIAASPAEDASAQVEEAYLTYLGLGRGLNLSIGQKHVPFGRTNLLHPHSWPYARQPLAITNLVGPESLVGAGANASYLLPTRGELFAQLDLGFWAPAGHSHAEHEGEAAPRAGEQALPVGTGAGFHDHFQTARLWLGRPLGPDGEGEVGGSYAWGPGEEGTRVRLLGWDVSYRRFGSANRRLLLRGEQLWRREAGNTARGYYLLGQQRLDKHDSVGLLYDWSQYPQVPSEHESAASLILTRQFNEQYYLRLQASRGSRPGDASYWEGRLQWVWGVGPHTHNLE